MNASVTPVRSLDLDTRLVAHATAAAPHLTTTDRIQLRIGLWLLLRTTRRIHDDRETHRLRLWAERDREARERTGARLAAQMIVR